MLDSPWALLCHCTLQKHTPSGQASVLSPSASSQDKALDPHREITARASPGTLLSAAWLWGGTRSKGGPTMQTQPVPISGVVVKVLQFLKEDES